MNWTKKTLAIAIAAIAAIGLGAFTAVENAYEPKVWNPDPSLYSETSHILYHSYTTTWPNNTSVYIMDIQKLSTFNFSEYGCAISLGYYLGPGPWSIGNIYGVSGGVDLWVDDFWIQAEKLAWPYQGVSIEFDSSTLAVNGTFLNVTNFDKSNELQYANQITYYTLPNGAVGGFNYYYNLGYPNSPPYASSIINVGNYSFTFKVTFTPVFEVGPYFFSGNQQTITYQYIQQIVDIPNW